MTSSPQSPPEAQPIIGLPTAEEFEKALENYLKWATRSPAHFPDGTPVRYRDLQIEMAPFFAHATGGHPTGGDLTTVRSDASFDQDKNGKFAGVSWQVTTPKRAYVPKTRGMQRFPGYSQMAEIHAVVAGLEQAIEKGAKHVLLQTDCQTAIHFLAGTWNPQRDYSVETHRRLMELVRQFDSVQVQWVRTKTHLKDVDRLSKRARIATQKGKEARHEAFIEDISKRMQDASFVRTDTNGIPRYKGYTPRLDPPDCGCPFWQKRVHPALMRNPRNAKWSCGHIAAAARDAGLTAQQAADLIVESYKLRRASA